MENHNRKIITMSFIAAGFIAAIVVNVLMETLAATFGVVAKYHTQAWVQHGLPATTGLILFAALQFNKKVVGWSDEVVVELKKVVWPSKKDTTAMTIVVCVMLLIAGVLLGFFDFVSSNMIGSLIN